MAGPLRLLMVEDSENDATLIVLELRRGGYDPTCERVEMAEALRAALARQEWDLVISDYWMPAFSGRVALELLRERKPRMPCICVTGSIEADIAQEVLRAGAGPRESRLPRANATRWGTEVVAN